MRVAAVQMTSTPDKRANVDQARSLLLQSLDRDPELVAFPEMFPILTDDRAEFRAAAEKFRGPLVETLQEWAAEYDVWILGGSMPIEVPRDPKRVTNTSLLISPDGEIRARYDKIHLFDAELKGDRHYRESSSVRAGEKPAVAKLPDGARAGLSVCYDLRFPELFREYAAKGCEVIFIPSAFTELTGKAHWDVLTRARAIENQAYVVAPAQTGEHYPGRVTYGHTRIIDPWGRVIAERLAGPGVVWADLNWAEVRRIRSELPALKHRKLRAGT